MREIQILTLSQLDSLATLPKKHLLVDTNFLIDAARYPHEFKELLGSFKKHGFTLVSIEATFVEFVKGSKSIEDYSKKVEFYKNIISSILPLEPIIYTNTENIIRILLKKGGQLSYTDSLLLGTTMKYKDSIYLLTGDKSDVPISLFNIVTNITIETQDSNCSFNIYEYQELKYEEKLQERIDDIPF